jgi:hypothetical protein
MIRKAGGFVQILKKFRKLFVRAILLKPCSKCGEVALPYPLL